MKVISLLFFLCTLAYCSEQKQDPYLCLDVSSIWYNQETNQFLLTARNCHITGQRYFLTSQGNVLDKYELPDALEISTTALFKTELGIHSNLEFLRPFYNIISWGSLRNDGNFLDSTNLSHFPLSFWSEVPSLGAAQLLANIPDPTELVNFIKLLKSKEVPVHKFVISASVPMRTFCHGPSQHTLCYPGDSIVVFSIYAQTETGSPRAIIRQEAHLPTFLWRKMFNDHDLVESEQPLYIYSKMY